MSKRQMQAVYADPVKGEIMREVAHNNLVRLEYNKSNEKKVIVIREYNLANGEDKN